MFNESITHKLINSESESEPQRQQRLQANQQREASCRASESESQRQQQLQANQQREVSRRASESEAQRQQ